MEPEEKELVWLPKKIAKQVKELEDPNSFVLQYIANSKKDIQLGFEYLDDSIIQYKGSMVKYKKEFDEAYQVAIEANTKIWEKHEEKRKLIKADAEALKEDLEPLLETLKEINSLLSKVNSYQIEKLLDIVSKISCSLNGEQGKMIKFLVQNYKQD